MKKWILFGFLFFVAGQIGAQKTSVTFDELPQNARDFISENFKNYRIVTAQKKTKTNKIEYEVKISNETEIEFNKNGNITEVECVEPMNIQAFPKIPADFVAANFPEIGVLAYKTNRNQIEIKLEDGTEIELTSEGNLSALESEAGLPESLIPERLRSHVKANYPEQKIIKYKAKANQQEIKLENGINLKFNTVGQPVSMLSIKPKKKKNQ